MPRPAPGARLPSESINRRDSLCCVDDFDDDPQPTSRARQYIVA
jgi:hypothetical protein